MIDWTKSMKQTYEFYLVNPLTGLNKQKLTTVTGATVTRDLQSDTQVSGSIEYDGELNEEYVRIYLVAEQGDEVEKIPLITMLCQTPSTSFNGKRKSTSITGYSPLIELENVYPPFGYTFPKYTAQTSQENSKSLDKLIPRLCRENMRMDVLDISEDLSSLTAEVMANAVTTDPGNSWFAVIQSLISNTDYMMRVKEDGIVYFDKRPNLNKMTPVWTFNTNNSSLLHSDISIDRDLYNVPNVVEIITTTVDGVTHSVIVENTDESSPTSIPSRGRKVVYREINPNQLSRTSARNSQETIQKYAYKVLEQFNTLEYRISYSHGYCGVNIGDAVYINYPEAGLEFAKAIVVSQKIDCKTGCTVEETAVFTKSLFQRGGAKAYESGRKSS